MFVLKGGLDLNVNEDEVRAVARSASINSHVEVIQAVMCFLKEAWRCNNHCALCLNCDL